VSALIRWFKGLKPRPCQPPPGTRLVGADDCRRGWTKSHGQVWLPGSSGRLHDLEQGRTGEGGELQLPGFLRSLICGPVIGDSARHHGPFKCFVEHHVKRVALAG